MDTNHIGDRAVEGALDNPELYRLIREVVETGGAYLSNIQHHCEAHGFNKSSLVVHHLNRMIQRREIRQKDDDMEHDWEYRKGIKWEEYGLS